MARTVSQTLKMYYRLTKPGIIYANVMTAIAGFFLASRGSFDVSIFVGVILGIAGVIASACVLNNYIDRNIDKLMARTKKRGTATGEVSRLQAMVFAAALGIVGFAGLIGFTNGLTVWLGVIAIVSYVVLYGYAKRHSVHGTLIGTIPGALPLVAGYTAVTNQFDIGALLLFVIMVAWQMPHFYAIAMYRRDDYARAKIPVISVVWGMKAAKYQIIAYVAVFLISLCLLTVFGYAGITYLVVMGAIGSVWLYRGIKGMTVADDVAWARGMFGFSLTVLLALSALLSVDVLLP